jgi:energy-coupling factor transporter ATP-binding protein EcfA2
MDDGPVLWCKDLRRRFKERLAVDGVGFEVAPGETYGLLGPNGAGKTTTISMICGLLRRDGGEVTVAGAASLIEARRLGVTRRLLATPTTAATILFGEALGRFAVALLQGLIIFLVGWLVFGVDWGDPPAALLLLVTFALVATGHLFPHAWAMDGFIALIARNAGLGGITRELAVLSAFAAVLLVLATWRLRRTLVG